MRSQSQGSILLTVVAVLAVAFFLLAGFVTYSVRKAQSGTRATAEAQALYTAEAGVAKAIWYLKGGGGRGPFWRTSFSGALADKQDVSSFDEIIPFLDSDASCLVSVEDDGLLVRVESTGHFADVQRTVSVLLGSTIPPTLGDAVILRTSRTLHLDAGTHIVGDIRVRGAVQVAGSAVVDGNINVGRMTRIPRISQYLVSRGMRKYDRLLSGSDEAQVLHSTQVFDQDRPLEFPTSGVLVVKGDVVIKGGSRETPLVMRGSGALVSTAGIFVSQNVRLVGDISLVAAGAINVSEWAEVIGGLLYSRGGINLSGHATLAAQVFSSADIVLGGQARVLFPGIVCTANPYGTTCSAAVRVLDQAVVNGPIISTTSRGQAHLRGVAPIEIGPQAVVNGVVYAVSSVSLRGTVNGCVIADSFLELGGTAPGSGQRLDSSQLARANRVSGGVVNRRRMPEASVLPAGLSDSPAYRLVSWMELYPEGSGSES